MEEGLYEQVKRNLPGLLRDVVGPQRAGAVLDWLDATDHVRGQGSEGTSGRVTAERELVSQALANWLEEASGAKAAPVAPVVPAPVGLRACRDCGATVDVAWWDSRRCEECWTTLKRATTRANKQRRRQRRVAA